MAAQGNPKFFTEHGEVRCVTENGRKRFLFFNPKSANVQETVAFMKTFTALGNYLPEAQEAARRFLSLRDCQPNEGSDEANRGQETDETVPPSKKRHLQRESSLEAETRDENTLYSKILYVYGKEPLIRVMLVVNLYEGNPYIWLKRFWYTPLDQATSQPAWLPCFGSYRFSLSDDSHELHRFAKKCLQEEEDEKRRSMAHRLQKRNQYHDSAVHPPLSLEMLPTPDASPQKTAGTASESCEISATPEKPSPDAEQEQDTQSLI
jgi:hypothetical protein